MCDDWSCDCKLQVSHLQQLCKHNACQNLAIKPVPRLSGMADSYTRLGEDSLECLRALSPSNGSLLAPLELVVYGNLSCRSHDPSKAQPHEDVAEHMARLMTAVNTTFFGLAGSTLRLVSTYHARILRLISS